MSNVDRLRGLAEPIAADLDVVLFDVEQVGPAIRVTLDRDGGVDMELIAEATRRLSRAIDEHDPIASSFTLEVSSPGLERTLRSPDSWRWALGREVSVKVLPGVEGDRRVRGTVASVESDAVVLDLADPPGGRRTLALADIAKARTIFEWGATPKKGSTGKKKGGGKQRQPAADRSEVETT